MTTTTTPVDVLRARARHLDQLDEQHVRRLSAAKDRLRKATHSTVPGEYNAATHERARIELGQKEIATKAEDIRRHALVIDIDPQVASALGAVGTLDYAITDHGREDPAAAGAGGSAAEVALRTFIEAASKLHEVWGPALDAAKRAAVLVADSGASA